MSPGPSHRKFKLSIQGYNQNMNKASAVFKGAIVFYFIIGLEVLIMISPFAGFFYSAFNPFLLTIAKYPATRWLSVFFLPHMVVPPDALLKSVRVAGSVLFLGGIGVFLVCATQVYANKLRRRGTTLKGLYSVIRHPQYAGLAVTGAGLAILWPRVLVVVLWLAMALVYYALRRTRSAGCWPSILKLTGSTWPAPGCSCPPGWNTRSFHLAEREKRYFLSFFARLRLEGPSG